MKLVTVEQVLRVAQRTSGRGGRGIKSRVRGESCASGAYRPHGYHGYKTSPIFFVHVSCRRVLRMHAATLVDFRSDGGFNRDDTRKQRCKVYATRDTVCYDFLWMNVELEEMNCWVRDIFNFSLSLSFSLSSTFFSFIYFLFVDFFVCPFFRFIFFYLLIFFFSLFVCLSSFFFRKPERGLESFNSFFGTNRKLVEQWKMVKIFSMKEWIVELTYIRESTLFVFTMYNSVHSPSFFLCNSHECI